MRFIKGVGYLRNNVLILSRVVARKTPYHFLSNILKVL